MKKKLLLLAFIGLSMTTYGQDKDLANREALKAYMGLAKNVESEEIRQIVIGGLDRILSSTTDQELIELTQKEKEKILAIKVKSYPSKDISTLDKSVTRSYDVKRDKFNKDTTVESRYALKSKYVSISLYQPKSDELFSYLKLGYMGRDWIFFTSATVLVDDETFPISVTSSKREVGRGGNVTEFGTVTMDDDTWKIIEAIVNYKKEVIIRLSGDKSSDYKLSHREIVGLKEMRDLFITLTQN